MEPTLDQPTDRKAYVSQYLLADLTAHWADHVSAVVISSRPHGLSIHLSPEQAAKLAADLISAVAESGAGSDRQNSDAFGSARDASLVNAGEIVGAALLRDKVAAVEEICSEYLDRAGIADDPESESCDEEPRYCHDDARRTVADRVRRALAGGETR